MQFLLLLKETCKFSYKIYHSFCSS